MMIFVVIVFIRAWKEYYHSVNDENGRSIQLSLTSLNENFHLSPHENSLTFALIV